MSKVTQEAIEAKIKGVYYINAGAAARAQYLGEIDAKALDVLTICIIELTNGFVVSGESACVDPANYVEELGRKIAYDNAVDEIWRLEGYLLKQKMYEESKNGN